MRVLVNATTCVVGGGVQVAATFVSHALRDPNSVEFLFAVSPQVKNNLNTDDQQDARLVEISPSPARLRKGRKSRTKLIGLEEQFKPDVVFTVFGPAYVKFSSTHICGFADPWVTHRSKIALSILPSFRRLHVLAVCLYKQWSLSPKDYYWVEAEVARRGLVRLLGIPPSKIKVIPNTYADVFRQPVSDPITREDNSVKVLTIAAPYPHKNLLIIPEVASILRKREADRLYRFIVTLPHEDHEVQRFWAKAKRLGVENVIKNAGKLSLQECPKWYASSDIVFLPTLLETFSATYLEAMVMGKPIVTTDLDFAHDICGDAAAYYLPLSAYAAAETIRKVATDHAHRISLVKAGKNRLSNFPSPREKYHLMMDWIREVVKKEHDLQECQ